MRTGLRFAAALAFGGLFLAAGEGGDRTVWTGVYSEAQAQRGAQAYAAHCQLCHGEDLGGRGEAKPLSGAAFLANWNGLSLGDMFERERTTMPFNAPKSLAKETYVDILAYILKFNGFPAGERDLPARSEQLTTIRFDAFKDASLGFAGARAETPTPQADPNGYPNPYVGDANWLKLPPGRKMGSTSAVAVDSRGHVWVVDRCAANSCAKSDLDPVLEFDAKGRFVKAFGRGMFSFPHGLFIDAKDHLWVTDAQAAEGKGAQVIEFDASGKVLMTLGKAGVSAVGPDTFAEPNAVVIDRDGTIFVSDGHTQQRDPARIVVFDAKGRFLRQWGVRGPAPGQMEVPHALALDSKGRLFVADRWNDRVDIFDRNGTFIAAWTQFGRPSGLFIDAHDRLYSGDSESRDRVGYGHHPGWRRGVRIGSAVTGLVDAFVPDDYPDPEKVATSSGEGIWVDRNGVIYSAEVGQMAVVRYTRR